jgi:hypothetical protein
VGEEEAMSEATVSALRNACDGLLYMSDSDEPFETLVWKYSGESLDAEKVLALAAHKAGDSIEEVACDGFFRQMLDQAAAQGEGAAETADKVRALQKVVKDQLSAVRVFKVGKVNIDVYIVGRTRDADWVGLHTKAVET